MTGTFDGFQPDTVQTDTIPTVKPRRNRASAKKAGTSLETQTASYLATELGDDRIERRAKTGSKDRGDIAGVRTIRGARVVIEVKNQQKLELGTWLTEAETEAGNDDSRYPVIVHKRHRKGQPADQWVTMTLDVFARLLLGGPDDLADTGHNPMDCGPGCPEHGVTATEARASERFARRNGSIR